MVIKGCADGSCTPLTDYDLTTKHGSDLQRFVFFAKNVVLEKKNTMSVKGQKYKDISTKL